MKKWIRLILFIATILGLAYAGSMFFVEEQKTFTIEKDIPYPVEKVYPQFNDFRNFTRWNEYFRTENDKMSINYFIPYTGQGASISFNDKKNNKGEMYIRYENPFKTLKYQLFEENDEQPYLINIKFKILSPEKTRTTWYIHTPKQSFLKRSINLWTENDFAEKLHKSITNLINLMGNKVDKEAFLTSVKYDSLMVEEQEGQLLLGINVSASNKGDLLFKSINLNHNKTLNLITMDLGKNEDEFGLPVLITDANNFKDKEISYFYGIPLSKRVSVPDNNFSFRTINASKNYVIYYRGNYQNRTKAIQQLLQKAKKDTMRYGELQQTFIDFPEENKEVNIKLSLPVYR